MARRSEGGKSTRVTNYRHREATRKNNPPASLAGEATVPAVPKAKYLYSPRLAPVLRHDPTGLADYVRELLAKAEREPLTAEEAAHLRDAFSHHEPWLEWANKREQHDRNRLTVDPVALHIHERISAQAILQVAARKDVERSLFADPEQAYHEAVQFYKHDIDWTNRLILGDSLSVMSSLARREDLAGKVQMIYMDPPYGIKFASNFQPEVGKRDVRDKDSDLTREPEMVKAYRDTWHLGIHSYLSYLRDRMIVAKELLAETGSIFVQIGQENLHRVRQLLDEIMGASNCVSTITVQKTSGFAEQYLPSITDFLLWYAKDTNKVTYHQLYRSKNIGGEGASGYTYVESSDGLNTRSISAAEMSDPSIIGDDWTPFFPSAIQSQGFRATMTVEFEHEGIRYFPGPDRCWITTPQGMRRLAKSSRLVPRGRTLAGKRYLGDYPVQEINNVWSDTQGGGFLREAKVYVVQTSQRVVERCMLMTTDPGDLVLDPTCGSGTTAYVAEQWGRRWITIDTSRVAVALARQRLLTGKFERFRLRDEDPVEAAAKNGQGIDPAPNFVYKTVPHITLGSIARNENLDPIFAKHEPILDERLAACNEALTAVDDVIRVKLAGKLATKMQAEGLKAATDGDRRRWLLPGTTKKHLQDAFAGKPRLKAKHVAEALAAVPPDGRFEHWHVPFDTDPDWPAGLRKAVEGYRKAWRAKMDEVNACIAANAEQEVLVDQPEVVKGVVRVSGPFTVEAVQPPELTLSDSLEQEGEFDGAPEELGARFETRMVEPRPDLDAQNLDAYLDTMIRLLKADGVKFPNNKVMKFARLDRLMDATGVGIHAEGHWAEAKSGGANGNGELSSNGDGAMEVAVVIGPQYGPVTSAQVVEAARLAVRRGYTDIVFAGFSFDAAAQAEIEHYRGKLRVHLAHIRPDVNPAMEGLLKEPVKAGEGELFAVFGEPRVSVQGPDEEGMYCVTMEGVDIYDPVKNAVRSTGATKVAAWFLDGDYDGVTFCTTQAFFPDRSAWDKLARALKGVVDEDAFEALSGTQSLPFPAGRYKRAAVKVIDPRGNEVMKVVVLGDRHG